MKTQTETGSTYFSFPASLEANLVYQTATLKAMETSSKTASCWALGGETVTCSAQKPAMIKITFRETTMIRDSVYGLRPNEIAVVCSKDCH